MCTYDCMVFLIYILVLLLYVFGREIKMKNAHDWNSRYQTLTQVPQSSQVLSAYTHLLPSKGKALDLASGLGANTVLLAKHGLETYAWDYADTALVHLQAHAKKHKVLIHTECRDVVVSPPLPHTFDVIVVCHFLERSLVPFLIDALKPNGLLFYQTFTRCKVSTSGGPQNPVFRLADNELLHLCQKLQIIVYCEEGNVGDIKKGFRNEALLIGQKC